MTASVPKVCRAAPAINMGPNYKLTPREDYPVPEPGEGELLCELKMTGICQSDHHYVCGDWRMLPMDGVDCTGHEGAGVVAKVGPGVTGWKVGDRVGITPVASTCEQCEYCTSGHETLCLKETYTAMHVNGTYTQYPVVKAQWAIKLPANVPYEQLAPFMCSGGTAYTAVKATEAKTGQSVVVFGAGGGVGHMVVQFCKAKGYKTIGVDLGADKTETVKNAGADAYIDLSVTKADDLPAEVQKLTDGLGAHAAIVAAGNGKAYAAAPTVLRPLGTVVAVGLPPIGTSVLGAEPAVACFKGIKFRGILVTTRQDMKDALALLEAGKVKEHVTLLPFKEFPAALERCAKSQTKGRQVIDFNA